MIITYIDSGVLLSATNGNGLIAEKALEILSNSHRVFAHKVIGIKVVSIFD